MRPSSASTSATGPRRQRAPSSKSGSCAILEAARMDHDVTQKPRSDSSRTSFAPAAIFGGHDHVGQPEGALIVVMARDLAHKRAALPLPQVAVEATVFVVHEPAIVPRRPFAFRERDRAAPGAVVGHGGLVAHELLAEPQVAQRGFVELKHLSFSLLWQRRIHSPFKYFFICRSNSETYC